MDKMKCIKNKETGNIIRVTNQQADQMVGRKWSFTPKSEWKSQERGTIITEEKTTENEQNRFK
jgi:hypothetical protein